MVNYGVVLLLGVESLMAGLKSNAGVVMSFWYGGYQTATPPPSYTTYATISSCTEVFKYYATKAPELYTTTYAVPSHYTDTPKYYSAPSYYTKATEYYMTRHAAPSYYTEAPNYYTEAPADYQNGRVLQRSGKVLLCPDLHN
ncbi:uncharacterized protein LOC124193202 [Daphnia pulex]|uniref:uncharacterized protein LOC124193202 n=1 Tax=Daphnia pulex TaxID=6669 RepID=UPI001EDFAFF5|nr:uncharacterized protein LOC124193202 [Daphnia pulex]